MLSRFVVRRGSLCLVLWSLLFSGCSCEPSENEGDGGTADGAVDTDGATGDGATTDGAAIDGATLPDGGPNDVCGDGILGITEACDEGDEEPGGGCAADCQSINPGWRCAGQGPGSCVEITCGDGRIDPPETCEDGNTTDEDGCSSTCQREPGWSCPLVGAACRAERCGDGIIAGAETCDVGQDPPMSDDGCSSTCQLEFGFQCPTEGAPCVPTVCGNGIIEGLEQCEDCGSGFIRVGQTCMNPSTGGRRPYDGCDPDCRLEPVCSGGVCDANCGDGVLTPGSDEECDDGNTRDGDGCSHDCEIEDGYACETMELPTPSTITVPAILRDFRGRDIASTGPGDPGGHIDFELQPAGSFLQGITRTTLGTARGQSGRPLRATSDPSGGGNESFPDSDDSFSWWYVSDATGAVNRTIYETLTLHLNSSTGTYTFPSATATEGPNYFPLDGRGFNAEGSVPFENPRDNGHNFLFTTELHYWFEYDGTERLRFVGDDDLWVFVDGRLCLHIGGQHGALSGIMNFQNTSEQDGTGGTSQTSIVNTCKMHLDNVRAAFQAMPGNAGRNPVVEMVVFGAERHTTQSNFLLQLSNFVKRQSICSPICGDGIVTREEVCDLGSDENDVSLNVGGYNGCMPDCTLGPYCGDGDTQEEHGETCDQGINNGATYGGCSLMCMSSAFCGDGVRQPESEQCDAGENNGAPGSFCTEDCRLIVIID